MFHWNTKQIIRDLNQINLVRTIENLGPSGDVDTDNLKISINGAADKLYICGFITTGALTNTSDCDCEKIELNDKMDPKGGLNSDDENVATAFLKIQGYFISKGVEVVDQL